MSGVEVTKDNFTEILPAVKEAIDKSVFVSIDLEFTGLTISAEATPSLFDTAADRYKKTKESVRKFTTAQFGLTAYHSVGTSSYNAYVYNFYLFPAAAANIDTKFVMQATSVQFLCQYKFDFNKMFYQGIPYLNRAQERSARSYWKRHTASPVVFDFSQKDVVRKYTKAVARWTVQARDGDIFTLEKDSERGDVPNEILHEKLRHSMGGVWPQASSDDVLIVEKVSKEKWTQLMAEHESNIDTEKFIETKVGFSALINHLINSQKPLVGHNMYTDLMFIYEKFIEPLPPSYEAYKESVHRCFPHVFDTKYMALQLHRSMEGTPHEYDSTGLSQLYNYMKENETAVIFAPNVTQANQSVEESSSLTSSRGGQAHEAGYDSYMCGYVFLRLAHSLTTKKSEGCIHPTTFYDYEFHLNDFKNRVNMIRASLHNICLDGEDPVGVRPNQLYVTARGARSTINIEEVHMMLSSYGSVDINEIANGKLVVAVSNFSSTKRILEAFKAHERLKVTEYSFLQHSPAVGRLVRAGLVITAGICTLAVVRQVRKRLFP